MRSVLADSDLEKLSAAVAERMGLMFPPAKWKTLEQSFRRAAGELGFKDVQECISRFTSPTTSKELIETMSCYLTVGETYFLREVRCMEILESQIVPEIVKKRKGGERRLRIWCAGCSTGEEPYSIAILLHRMHGTLRDWDISILATDINPHSLRKAREGVYTNWSFRTAPPWFKEDFFRQTADKAYALLPHIKEMVTFSGINLAEDCYPSLVTDTTAIDVIFCRNVLMYFTPQHAARVVERFKRCLLDGGWLFVSPCETSNASLAGFNHVPFPGATLYRTSGEGAGNIEPEQRGKAVPGQAGNGSPIRENSRLQQGPQIPRLPLSPVPRTTPVPPLSDAPVQEPASPYRKALALYERGAYGEAVEMVAEQLALEQKDTDALALLCRIYANEGKLTEALDASDRALAADKLSAGLHYLRAVILQELGVDDEAAASLKTALYLDQDLVLAHFALANLKKRQGKVRESQRHFDNALSLLEKHGPDDVIAGSDGMSAGRLKEIIRATAVAT